MVYIKVLCGIGHHSGTSFIRFQPAVYQPLLLLLLQFSSGNTLDFDELFIGVRSGPALYCFDVTNDDGSSSSMALMELKLKCLHKKSATCSTTNIPLRYNLVLGKIAFFVIKYAC